MGKDKDFESVIFTPVYRGKRYLYHECSECGYTVEMREGICSPLYFGETFKFCPNCGKDVIRFAQIPKFLEEVNTVLFEKINSIYDAYIDEAIYYLHCELSKSEREDLVAHAEFAIALEDAGGGMAPRGAYIVKEFGNKKMSSHWEVKKLKDRINERRKK